MKKIFFSFFIILPIANYAMEPTNQEPQTPVANRAIVAPNAPARRQALHRENIHAIPMNLDEDQNARAVAPNAPAREQALHRAVIHARRINFNVGLNEPALQVNDPVPNFSVSFRNFTEE